MKRVVSVSLGSPKGDKTVRAVLLGEEFEISRIGTDGDMEKFAALVRELDGKVDAIGLGGIDLYLYAGSHRYTIRDAAKLAANAKTTPVVDGSGIKNTIERETIDWLQDHGVVDFAGKKVLVVCGVDRFGMAQAVWNLTKSVVYGDLMFDVGVPVPIRGYRQLELLARSLLPVVRLLPFQWLYPTGKKQEKTTPKHERFFRWADVIAGDCKIIMRFMPPPESGAMSGKVVVTNTLTSDDVESLRLRGVETLVTSTPEFEGRTFATNVLEGIIIALTGKRPEDMSPADYLDTLRKLEWTPTVRRLA